MKEREANPTFETGYRRPPKKSQFKPGQSGNPKGRPKKTDTAGMNIIEAMNQNKSVVINGKKRELNSYEIGLLKAFEKASKGEFKAVKSLFELFRKYEVITPPHQLDQTGVLLSDDIDFLLKPDEWDEKNLSYRDPSS